MAATSVGHAQIAILICVAHCVANMVGMTKILAHENKRNNVNKALMKDSGALVGIVNLLSINFLSSIRFFP